MLDTAHDLEPTSRLSCQILVTEEIDGLVVKPRPGRSKSRPQAGRPGFRSGPQFTTITIAAAAPNLTP